MLSILIPVYNYDITELVKTLVLQIEPLRIEYEVIAIDDGSTNEAYVSNNLKINNYKHCKLLSHENNMGRTETRINLAQKATYKWLLFLDSDVMPFSKNFVSSILKNLDDRIDFIFGGVRYNSKKPLKKTEVLRWKYGIKKEVKPLNSRREMPYSSIISQNFLIRKSICSELLEKIKSNRYGLDILFSHELEKKDVSILHINNPTIHLGLEDTSTFIKKSIESLNTTYYYESISRIPKDYRPIQKSYLFLKKNGGIKVFKFVIKIFEKLILKNLYSYNPIIFLFDLYRLYHFILIKEK